MKSILTLLLFVSSTLSQQEHNSVDHAVSYPVLYKKPTPIHKLVWILSHPISKFVSERQTELNDPYIVIGGVGAGNLIATGAAFLANRQEIDSLKTRVAKLETILSNTCSKVVEIATAAKGTIGAATALADITAIVNRVIAVSAPTCSA